MADGEEKKKPDSRWWEFYFVRYFVGTAIGGIIILFLSKGSPFLEYQGEIANVLLKFNRPDFDSSYVAVLATIGLAFCYISSAPILVLHATRGSLLAVRDRHAVKPVFVSAFIFIFLMGAVVYRMWHAVQNETIPDISHFYAGLGSFFITCVLFVFQLYLLWLSFIDRGASAYNYYHSLASKRSLAKKAGEEYIESYRHLREHGNAFFIALLELLLAASLYYSPIPWPAVLMLWILPAVGVWLLGTMLESRDFPDNPESPSKCRDNAIIGQCHSHRSSRCCSPMR